MKKVTSENSEVLRRVREATECLKVMLSGITFRTNLCHHCVHYTYIHSTYSPGKSPSVPSFRDRAGHRIQTGSRGKAARPTRLKHVARHTYLLK
jgi:hypothetical protein